MTNHQPLQGLAKMCSHRRRSQWLKGTVKVERPGSSPIYVNRTALAGACPEKLTEAYADIVQKWLNLGSQQADVVKMQWSASLRGVEKRKAGTSKQRREKSTITNLQKQGGLVKFFDFIALGRPKEEAWKFLKATTRQKRKSFS